VNRRPAFQCNEVGKHVVDAWSKELVYSDRPFSKSVNSAAEQILRTVATPLQFTNSWMFVQGLTNDERLLLAALASGYPLKEVPYRNAMSISCISSIRRSLQPKVSIIFFER
jgi:hypothetical protein